MAGWRAIFWTLAVVGIIAWTAAFIRLPETRRALFIALTGYGQPEDRRRALEAGFDEHLSKPVDLRSLRKLLSRRDLTSGETLPSH